MLIARKELHTFCRSQPTHYVSHLLGHEGKGSLLSELKRRRWANGLSAYSWHAARGFEFFEVELELTPEGLERLEEVLEHLFAYLRLLRETDPLERVYEETRDLRALKFRFKDKRDPIDYVATISKSMHV